MNGDYHGGHWNGNEFTNMVGSEIESFLAHVFTRMNTGLEEQRGRGGRAGGRGGGDHGEGQSEGGEEGEEAHFRWM